MEPSQVERGSTESSITTPPGLGRPLVARAEAESEPSAAGGEDKVPSTAPVATPADHSKFAEEVHNYVREYIRNADQKATSFFAVATAMLAFLNTQNVPSRWLKEVRTWSFIDFLGFLSMSALGIAAGVFLGVVFPRLRGSRRGILFFKAIAEHENSGEYAQEVIKKSGDDLLRAKLYHDFDLSKVCVRKHRTLVVGFWIGSVGIGAALLYLFLTRSGP